MVYDAEKRLAEIFVGGKRQRLIRYQRALSINLMDARLGAWNREPRCFRGLMDEVRVYGKALDDQAVAKLAAGKGPEDGLLAWWKLDETAGRRASDSSGNRRHMEIFPVEIEEGESEEEEYYEDEFVEEEGQEAWYLDVPSPPSTPDEWLQTNFRSLRRAVEHLDGQYSAYREKARRHLARLDAVEKRYAAGSDAVRTPDEMARLKDDLVQLQREALVADNPLLRCQKLLFIRRYTYQSSHFYTDFIDGCELLGGNLCTLSLADGKVTELVPSLSGGVFGRFDLSFDARRVVFDYKPSEGEGFRLYEVGIDGRGLRRLTSAPPDENARIEKYDNSFLGGTGRIYNHHTDDMHPCYLPDGRICFTSSRCEFGTLCDGPDILSSAVLHRIDGDGRHMVKLTNSAVSEFSPSVMPDGRVLYTRWEYVDKGQIGIKCLWAMRPDGTGTVEIFGNDHAFPPTLLHGRAIPDRNDMFVVLGTPHFPQSGIGTVIRLDINHPIRTRRPMTYITPHVDVRQEPGWNHLVRGRWVRHERGPLYMDPYPLSDKFFLVSYNPDKPWNDARAYGLYLLDEFGNHVPIYRDAEFSSWQPTPLRPRRRPPVLPSHSQDGPSQGEKEPATLVMSDVYVGLSGVARGTIKYLRVMEQVPRPWASRRFWDQECEYGHHSLLSVGSVIGVKVLHGIVPVYEDGSAHFIVPPDRSLYFQALDKDYMEVQRMRTYVNLRPGERRSCIGCHTPRRLAPHQRPIVALSHPASKLEAQPGEIAPRAVHYPTDVQPVLDRHCVSCHGGPLDDAPPDLTGKLTEHFSRSYEGLMRRGLVRTTNEGADFSGTRPVPPRTVGSHGSRLIGLLRKGHYDVKLSPKEMIKLTTWVDANGQYYGTYYGRRHVRFRGHPNFRPAPTFTQATSPQAPISDDPRGGLGH